MAAGLKKERGLAATARFAPTTGAVFAVISVLLGFMASSGRAFTPEMKFSIDAHRIFGIATAGLSLLATVLAAGYFGAEVTHGPSHLLSK